MAKSVKNVVKQKVAAFLRKEGSFMTLCVIRSSDNAVIKCNLEKGWVSVCEDITQPRHLRKYSFTGKIGGMIAFDKMVREFAGGSVVEYVIDPAIAAREALYEPAPAVPTVVPVGHKEGE